MGTDERGVEGSFYNRKRGPELDIDVPSEPVALPDSNESVGARP